MNARDATAVLEALPLAVLMAEPGGRVTYANPAAHALFSRDVETLTPAERARCWATRRLDGSPMSGEDLPTMRAIRGERLRDFEYRIVHPESIGGIKAQLTEPPFSASPRISPVLLVKQNVAKALALPEDAYVIERGRIVLHGPARMVLDSDAVWPHT